MSQPFISQRLGYQLSPAIRDALPVQHHVDAPLTMVEVERCPRCQHILLYDDASSTYHCQVDGFTYFAYRPQESCDEYDNMMQFMYHHQHGDQPVAWTSQNYVHQFTLTTSQWQSIQDRYHTRVMAHIGSIHRTLTSTTENSMVDLVSACDLSCWDIFLLSPEWQVLQPWSHLLYQCWMLQIPWSQTWHPTAPQVMQIAPLLQSEKDPYTEHAHLPPISRHKQQITWLHRLIRQLEKTHAVGWESLRSLVHHVGTEKPNVVSGMKKRKTGDVVL
jgi:hypothetical protein